MSKVMSHPTVVAHEVAETVIRGLVKGVGVQAFFTGLHNAFCFGEVLKDDYEVTDAQLAEMFEHFEVLDRIAREIE